MTPPSNNRQLCVRGPHTDMLDASPRRVLSCPKVSTMCGIAGVYGQPNEELLAQAMRRLAHRGPDGQGAWIDPHRRIGMAHTRLSIIDLPGGAQPLFNEDRSVAVVFNGEIYNYVELRQDLIARGHHFRTQTDTEVLVHLYEEAGQDFLNSLRGMFALALWDDRAGRLLLARDRVGKKPLYYTTQGDRLMFASEIKGLRAMGLTDLRIDDQALSDYLTLGHVPAPATIWQTIRMLPPGFRLIAEQPASVRVERYWQWPAGSSRSSSPTTEAPTDVGQAADRIEPVLAEAVRLRLRADVPVGVFLSGGIDSGLIVAMAARQLDRPLTTLSVGFASEQYDERSLARQVADRYSTDHHELIVRPEPERLLPLIVDAYDQPYADSSAIPSYALAELARRHVKVVLNGDGGDEVFAGYRRYVAAWLTDRLGPAASRWTRPGWRLADRLLPETRGYRTGYAFLRRLARGLGLPETERLLAWGNEGFDEASKQHLAARRSDWLQSCQPTGLALQRLLESAPGLRSAIDRQMWVDAQTLLPDDLLVKMDIATMAHGLEARSPLLDHCLIETLASWPVRLKLAGQTTKPILRELARRHLPPEIAAAPKRGFEVPLAHWLDHELLEMRNDLLLRPTGLMADRFDRSAIEAIVLRRTPLDTARWARQVWTLMMLALWDRRCRG